MELRCQEERDAAEDELVVTFPESELARVSKIHEDALSIPTRFINVTNTTPANNRSLRNAQRMSDWHFDPECLIGKPIRLYCPLGNLYHNGRIVDRRKATHTKHFWPNEMQDTEFLVQFPAGVDYRKTTLRQWVLLEEHALAVGITLVWGQVSNKKGILGWRPAQTWLRTSLELHPVRTELSEEQGQICFMHGSTRKCKDSWALCQFLGEDHHALLLLKDEAVDFFSPVFGQLRHLRNFQHPVGGPTSVLSPISSASPGSSNASKKQSSDHLDRARLELSVGLASAEWKEQTRVFEWFFKALEDPVHPRALSLRDEVGMGPIRMEPPHKLEGLLCPNIPPKGLDRLFVMELYKGRGLAKDALAASDETFQFAKPSPQIMKEFREQEKE